MTIMAGETHRDADIELQTAKDTTLNTLWQKIDLLHSPRKQKRKLFMIFRGVCGLSNNSLAAISTGSVMKTFCSNQAADNIVWSLLTV